MKLDIEQVILSIEQHRIVDDLSLHVEENEIVGLIGPNGSGKTTLLRSVYRMLRPEAGLITLGGDDVWKLSARESAKRTGIVIQESPGDFDFTVQEIVEMGRTPHKKMFEADNRQDEMIVAVSLDKIDMSTMRDRQFNTLSGGEKQRVLVARALAQQPKLLVLDEPTNHLDIQHQLEVLSLIRQIKITTLITLHDLNLAALFCDRLYLLDQGHIVACGTPEDVLNPDMIWKVYHVRSEVSTRPENGKLAITFVPQ